MKLAARFVAAGALVLSGWVAQDFYTDMKEEAACSQNEWECPTHMLKALGAERDRRTDAEVARIGSIFKELGVPDAQISACDRTIADGLALRTADIQMHNDLSRQAYQPGQQAPVGADEVARITVQEIEGFPRNFGSILCASQQSEPAYFAKVRPEFVAKFVAPFK